MKKAVEALVKTLESKLGTQLEAVYLFGSAAQGHHTPGSDVNLFVVIQDGTSMKEVRLAFQPVWEKYQDTLKRAPYVATKNAFLRYLFLDPLMAQQLVRDSKQLFGRPGLIDKKLATFDPHEAYAYLVTEVMQVSAALAPNTLDEATAVATKTRLQRLARKLRNEPLPANETALQSFARIQHFLQPIMANLPATKKWAGTVPFKSTTPLLPGLQATYDEAGTMILVFNRLTPHQILQTDWEKLAARLPPGTAAMQITTVEQMALSIMFDRPLDLRFKKLKHAWGPDFLAAFKPSTRQIMRYSARVPARILQNELTNTYLIDGSREEAQHKIIHDFQNKMLNIQLEHELLVRFEIVERFVPPTPPPGRETPAEQRVTALFRHLDWWADFYAKKIK